MSLFDDILGYGKDLLTSAATGGANALTGKLAEDAGIPSQAATAANQNAQNAATVPTNTQQQLAQQNADKKGVLLIVGAGVGLSLLMLLIPTGKGK